MQSFNINPHKNHLHCSTFRASRIHMIMNSGSSEVQVKMTGRIYKSYSRPLLIQWINIHSKTLLDSDASES